jgi:hypothetical protein
MAYSGMHSPARRQARAEAQLDRRKFLTALGFGAAGVAGFGTILGGAGTAFAQTQRSDRFGRMFPGLPSFVPNDARRRQALVDMGVPGGLMDARDNLAAGPDQLILDASLSANNPNNTTHTAGTTFFGQFLDHDMTLDATTALGVTTPPENSPNGRTPAFDLDSVYGGGPQVDPELYQADRVRLRIESGGIFEDVPRTANRTAIIADPRNDENLIISGMQAAFILFHNAVVQRLQDSGFSGNLFQEARRLVTWHYQWIIVNQFLPQILGQNMVNSILSGGRRWFRPSVPFIPVEFQLAYRFGHSMIRPSYAANLTSQPGRTPFFAFIFDPAGEGQADPVDLRGGARAPRRFISWNVFFNFNDGNVRPNKLIDTKLSTPLFRLPLATLPDGAPPISLVTRNLLRHLTWSAPAGQRIAQTMGNEIMVMQELANFGDGVALENQTPVWYYVLAEAERRAGGLTLGPTGGRLMGEVFIGLLQLDPTSYLRAQPNFRPTLGPTAGSFTMQDLLTVAGVHPAARAARGF